MNTQYKLPVGYETEEILRHYFVDLGLFVVRGLLLRHENHDVTDVDLWLYSRVSPFRRERISVDVKNKRTPEAMSRVLWARGLQAILGLDASIVATTDKQAHIKNFGRLHGVTILDGNFLNLLSARYEGKLVRFSDEELFNKKEIEKSDKKRREWFDRILAARDRLLSHLNFDGCNAWIDDCRYFIEQVMTSTTEREHACRYFYLAASYLHIGIDYVLHRYALCTPQERAEALSDGFKYGELGKGGHSRTLDTSIALLKALGATQGMQLAKVRGELERQLGSLPIDSLIQYFTRQEISKDLFSTAISLEGFAYNRTFTPPEAMSPAIKGVVGLLLDYHKIDRKSFFESRFAVHVEESPSQKQLDLKPN